MPPNEDLRLKCVNLDRIEGRTYNKVEDQAWSSNFSGKIFLKKEMMGSKNLFLYSQRYFVISFVF